jgi:uncharacterized protein YcfJ
MRRTLMIAGLAAAMAVPTLAAPTLAQARTYCDQRAHDRRVTGTVIGAIGGALVGNAVSHRNGAVIGGLGGAVVGNQLARTKCDRGYSYNRHRRAPANTGRDSGLNAASYDRCRYETRSFYDERGRLIQQPTRVCDR